VWPEDVTPSAMLVYEDEVQLQPDVLGLQYEQLIKEVGTMVSNKAILPAETVGAYGWEFDFRMNWVFNEAINRVDARGNTIPSPWDMAHQKEDSLPYQWIPSFGARKGLPWSTEVGASAGWIGMSNTAMVTAYGRVALIEGYKPWPDVTLQMGYGGYVGNSELEVGAFDMGVTLGSTYYTGRIAGAHNAQVSPWANFTMLRVSSASKLDASTQNALGAKYYKSGRTAASAGAVPPMAIPRVAAGWQITSQNMHARVGLSWAPDTIPTLNTGMGMTF
jgi:hypothetical protein